MTDPLNNEGDRNAIRIRTEILRETGAKVSTEISVEEALRPALDSADEKPPPDPGDEDPSREIPSAEVGMTFYGGSNHGSADLEPFTARRFVEIAKHQAEAEQKRTKLEPPANS